MLNKYMFYIETAPFQQDISKSNFDTDANIVLPDTYFGYKRIHFVVITVILFSGSTICPNKNEGMVK